MVSRMMWEKARKRSPSKETPKQRRLERQADHMILNGAPQHLPKVVEIVTGERCYYRSVGTVSFDGEVWRSHDASGAVIGEHSSRWMAWREADKLGMERAGALG